MNCLDSSVVIAYLQGDDAIGEFVSEYRSRPLFAPSFVLFESYRGAARRRGVEGIAEMANDLDWIEPLPVTEECAREAAQVDAELHDDGNPLGLGDCLIAGTVRCMDGTLVTRDDDFEVVPDLDVRYV